MVTASSLKENIIVMEKNGFLSKAILKLEFNSLVISATVEELPVFALLSLVS